MTTNKKLFFILSVLLSFNVSFEAIAKDDVAYPNITGKALFELRADKVTTTDKQKVDANSGKINIDADFALNFNKNWSLITDWKFKPVMNQDPNNPERYRNILLNRGFGMNDEGLVVEQLKGQFENEDARFFFGKFNPVFGSAFKKEKRIGVFTTDFTKDYELREKIGFGITALLENSDLTADAFFNDTTALNDSAINKRGREKRSDGIAGNTSTPSSYTIAMEGQDLLDVKNLFYNLGYQNLAVDNMANRNNQTGFVGGLEYLFPLGLKTSLIPFVEIASINNLSGENDRNVNYATFALVGKYSSWTTSISTVIRDIRQKNTLGNQKDRQIQYSIGYKFSNNVVVDFSRVQIKENGYSASLLGAIASYVYSF